MTQSETQGEARLGPWSLLLCDTQKSYFCFEYREFCLEWRKSYKNEQCIMHIWWMLLERDETQTSIIALSVAMLGRSPSACDGVWNGEWKILGNYTSFGDHSLKPEHEELESQQKALEIANQIPQKFQHTWGKEQRSTLVHFLLTSETINDDSYSSSKARWQAFYTLSLSFLSLLEIVQCR